MDERLQALQAEMEEEQTLRRKRDSLEVEYRSLCSYERELAVLRQKELEDVARMEQGFSLWYLQRTWSKRNFFPAGGRRGKFPNGRKTACQRRWYFLWQQYQRYHFGWKRLSLSFACFGRRRKCHCWRSGRCPVKTGHLFLKSIFWRKINGFSQKWKTSSKKFRKNR